MRDEIVSGAPLGPRPVSAVATSDRELLVVFNTGETLAFDVTPLLDYPAYRPLRNQSLFRKPTISFGTVTWPGGIDICPDLLYEQGHAV